ncbi:MAG: thioredoxin family protein [Aureispira sp.]|nr:thioredoxin family protein [Aureispira sp.]
MKSIWLTICSTFMVLGAIAQDGIHFEKGTWEEVLAKAKKEHKIIFVDAYTTWCGPCKRMAKSVFPDKEVGKFYNKYFINYKMDMEKGEGPKFAQKYRVNSYPTLLYIDYDGEVVHVGKGARPTDQFIGLGKEALSKFDKTGDYKEKYEAGERDAEFLRAYAYALISSAKPALKIANEYFRTQKDLTTKTNLEFLFDFASEADSKIFETLLENKSKVIEIKGQKEFDEVVKTACEATVAKAVEYRVEDLLKEAKAKMKSAVPHHAKEFSILADLQYNRGIDDVVTYVKIADKYLKKYGKKKSEVWNRYALEVLRLTEDAKLLQKAESWAKTAYELNNIPTYARTYATFLHKRGKTEEAEKIYKNQPRFTPK